jgi:very-short-patch-repair endonuclease
MAELKCKNCGKKLSGRWKSYCSVRCGSLFYIKTHHKETDIEKKVREWMESKNIKFEEQASISNITVPDFKIGNTIFYCDGDFWHDQKRRKYKDGIINKRLVKLGYKVIRFKGSDILHNFDKVTTKILNNI